MIRKQYMGHFMRFKHFSSYILGKMLVIKTGIHQMLVRIANLKKQSDLSLLCLPKPFGRQLV